MSRVMRIAVCEHLNQLWDDPESGWPSRLLFVFAGTAFVYEGMNNSNNILHIISGTGIELEERYYKFSPFNTVGKPDRHGFEKKSQVCEIVLNCEHLTEPEKECLLLDIENVGRILPSVLETYVLLPTRSYTQFAYLTLVRVFALCTRPHLHLKWPNDTNSKKT